MVDSFLLPVCIHRHTHQFKLADTRFTGFFKYRYNELTVNLYLVEANYAITLQILTNATSVLNF